ncbi:ABC transporter substrate-binding protein [Piscinibacter koreensis]|uniref:Bicyclomycin resistance protein n=1 Tax=Piscinibacter koreensis TaxID=2742824 RepID=A0A7Y6TUU9_9BURK|nr:ABC transporter substrate-binding protein [Schlegelella koreensis]NUZ04429.1 bicyclomycin resistance protein [Schlegelella koreensis]
MSRPPITRREWLALAGAGAAGLVDPALAAVAADPAGAEAASAGAKVLRLALRAAETGFDPAQVTDLYSRMVTGHIFEGLYQYDHLARPFRIKPLTADGMPESSDDFKVWTVRVRPGIYFAEDPAFGGKRRELVAADYVYTFKRFFDPALKSPVYQGLTDEGYIGLEELREAALKNRKPFDYDREVEGARAIDRYTIRFKLSKSRPRFLYGLAGSDLFGAVAREVVERYRDDIMAHPVGTGPFVLRQWRRSSLIVLERNPTYRERTYDAEPAADDAEGQALLRRFKGRRLPMVDRVELSVIEPSQPRWLAFLNGQLDLIDPVPPDLAKAAVPNAKLAPNLERRGIRAHTAINSDIGFTYFNMEDPVIGGLEPEKVALRRAICLGLDIPSEIRLIRNGQAIQAQGMVVPNTYGYDPSFKSEIGDYSPARANALLDVYGYVDRDRDGWRERPDGSPLVLQIATQGDELQRQLDELRRKDLTAIGIRTNLKVQQWPENLKAARAGKLQMWSLASSASSPDGFGTFAFLHGPQAGSGNFARFKLKAVDDLYARADVMPDSPERIELFRELTKYAAAYAPYKFHSHRIYVDLTQPWLLGYRRPLFWLENWMYLDIDTARRGALQA